MSYLPLVTPACLPPPPPLAPRRPCDCNQPPQMHYGKCCCGLGLGAELRFCSVKPRSSTHLKNQIKTLTSDLRMNRRITDGRSHRLGRTQSRRRRARRGRPRVVIMNSKCQSALKISSSSRPRSPRRAARRQVLPSRYLHFQQKLNISRTSRRRRPLKRRRAVSQLGRSALFNNRRARRSLI